MESLNAAIEIVAASVVLTATLVIVAIIVFASQYIKQQEK